MAALTATTGNGPLIRNSRNAAQHYDAMMIGNRAATTSPKSSCAAIVPVT